MAPSAERRIAQRVSYKLPMALYRLDYQESQDSFYAEMNDCSDKGLSMMTSEKLVLGESVCVKLKNNDFFPHSFLKEKTVNGIIRWGMRYQSDKGAARRFYKYGIEFSTKDK